MTTAAAKSCHTHDCTLQQFNRGGIVSPQKGDRHMEKYKSYTYVDIAGVLHVGEDTSGVMVPNEALRSVVADNFGPGIFAYTPGLENVWQLKADGTWADVE